MPEEQVVLGLGSNTGDSLSILKKAIADIAGILRNMRVSSLYLTMPQDVHDQNDFCNMAASGWYTGTPESLLDAVQTIERRYGRDRNMESRRGPRTLDIDILLFGSRVIRTDTLVVPHDRMGIRQFALVPLLEILPESTEPGTGLSYRAILESVPEQGVKKVGNLYGY